MGLLDRLFGGGGASASDGALRPIAVGHPEVGPALEALTAKQDVRPASRLFEAARGRWHLRWMVVSAVHDRFVATAPDAGRLVDGWIAAAPHLAFGYLVRALAAVGAGWNARGTGADATVAADARARFERQLRAAVPDLERAAQLDPADPTPHYILMSTAPGIHADADAATEAVTRHHAQAIARAPDHYLAQRRLVYLRSARWYGSHRDALDVARRASARATPGSELAMLVVAAHEDARSYLQFIARDPAAARAHVRRLEVSQDVDSAYAASLGSPHHVAGELTPYRRHEAALWFWVTGDRARARIELERVGPLFDPDREPWHVPAERYLAIRTQVGL